MWLEGSGMFNGLSGPFWRASTVPARLFLFFSPSRVHIVVVHGGGGARRRFSVPVRNFRQGVPHVGVSHTVQVVLGDFSRCVALRRYVILCTGTEFTGKPAARHYVSAIFRSVLGPLGLRFVWGDCFMYRSSDLLSSEYSSFLRCWRM